MTNEEQIFVAAVRYALPRHTYIVDVIVDFLCTKELTKFCKDVISRDINETIKRDEMYGMDSESWKKLLKHCEL